jgi:hypothetical protein
VCSECQYQNTVSAKKYFNPKLLHYVFLKMEEKLSRDAEKCALFLKGKPTDNIMETGICT